MPRPASSAGPSPSCSPPDGGASRAGSPRLRTLGQRRNQGGGHRRARWPGTRATAAALLLGSALAWAAVLPAAGVSYDYGDAPLEYDLGELGPARAVPGGLRLGVQVSADTVDPDTGTSTSASTSALRDTGDDGVSAFPSLPVGRLLRSTVAVRVSGVTAPARLCGWVDFDRTFVFDPGERACVDVAPASETVQLSWVGRPLTPGRSYVRLRIGRTAAQVERPAGTAGPGEVEDYPVTFRRAAPSPRPSLSLTTTATPASVSRSGQQVALAYLLRNTGSTPVSGVGLIDPAAGSPIACEGELAATLPPGGVLRCTATRVISQADLDLGALEVAAEARGEGPTGDATDPGDDVVAVGPARVQVRQQPGLALTMDAEPERPQVGELVTVTTRLVNTGNVTLTAARSLLTPRGLDTSCLPSVRPSLAPGETQTCTTRVVVSTGDARRGTVVLQGTGRAERPYGDPGRPADDVLGRRSLTLRLAGTPDPGPPSSPGRPDEGSTPTSAPAPAPAGPTAAPPATPSAGPSAVAGGGSGQDLARSGGPGAGAVALGATGSLAVVAGVALLALARRRRLR